MSIVILMLCLLRLEQDIQGAFGGMPGSSGQLGDGCEKRLVTEQSSMVMGLENLSVAKFLDDIGLGCLQDIFDKEQITMDILVEMGHDELKDIGISAYGHRHKILKRIERLTVLYGTLLLICNYAVILLIFFGFCKMQEVENLAFFVSFSELNSNVVTILQQRFALCFLASIMLLTTSLCLNGVFLKSVVYFCAI